MRPIRKGERVLEYLGERMTHAMADRRYAVRDDVDVHTMLFTVNNRIVIDATRRGNSARWINHSCDPNSETVQYGNRIYIQAIRDIKPGEELTYDYQLYLEERHSKAAKAAYPCFCGAQSCRGTLLVDKR